MPFWIVFPQMRQTFRHTSPKRPYKSRSMSNIYWWGCRVTQPPVKTRLPCSFDHHPALYFSKTCFTLRFFGKRRGAEAVLSVIDRTQAEESNVIGRAIYFPVQIKMGKMGKLPRVFIWSEWNFNKTNSCDSYYSSSREALPWATVCLPAALSF